MPDEELIIQSNGLDITTGLYLPTLTETEATIFARGEAIPEREVREFQQKVSDRKNEHFGPARGVDPLRLDSSGWGVLFPKGFDPKIREKLKPLLDWRKELAGPLYREFSADTKDKVAGQIGLAYQPDESKTEFLEERGVFGSGPVDPKDGVPYYVLIVASPAEISYRFQYQLDVQYAVGRIHFDDLEDYAVYADSVVQAEKNNLVLDRRISFFGVANPNDEPTQSSARDLIKPMVEFADGKAGWKVKAPPAEETTRENLQQLLSNAPALFLSASHGASVPISHPAQQRLAGSLICQDWRGPVLEPGPVSGNCLFKSSDVPAKARLHGSILMFFACYGAGMPQFDDFPKGSKRPAIAETPFVAALPKRLLAHREGGALAVISHVERAWGTSYFGRLSGSQTKTFESTFTDLMDGKPVGFAMEFFNSRYSEVASDIASELQTDRGTGFRDPTNIKLVKLWLTANDARNYCVIGDPFAKLNLGDTASNPVPMPQREIIEVKQTPPPDVPVDVVHSFDITSININGPAKPAQPEATLSDTLKDMLANIGGAIGKVVNGLTTVEVCTYVSNDGSVKYEDGVFTGAELRAVTRIGIDGKMIVCVPKQTSGAVDDPLWQIHKQAVEQAVANRADMLKLVADAAARLASLKP